MPSECGDAEQTGRGERPTWPSDPCPSRRQFKPIDARARLPADDSHGVAPRPRYGGAGSFSMVQKRNGPSLEKCNTWSRMLASSTRIVKPPARYGHQQAALRRYAPSAGISMR